MKTDSASRGNSVGDYAEVSRWHSSQTPSVMAGTRRRPEHLVGKGGALSDLNTRTPSGEDVTQRIVMKPAFSEDLLGQVLRPENLQAAWKRVRANKGAAGIDGMTIDEFPAWVKSGHWKEIVKELETDQYYPFPVRRVEIDKPDGGKRQLGIPTVTDRVIQQAIAQVLTPIFDPDFSNNSFGFRPNRNGC